MHHRNPLTARWAGLICGLTLACAMNANAAPAASPRTHSRKHVQAGPKLPGVRVEFVTSDSWTIVGTYSAPKPDKPTLLFLHGLGSGSYEWIPLASRLAEKGYGTLAYDARGHGSSRNHAGTKTSYTTFTEPGEDNPWNKMTLDIDAALTFLASTGVASSSVAFCGASIGANIVLKAAGEHKETPFLILLSPGMNYHDVFPVNPIRAYGKRPLLIAASLQNDDYALQSSDILYKLAVPNSGEDKVTFLQSPDKHGAPMLEDPATMSLLLGWIDAAAEGRPYVKPVAVSTATAAPGVSTPTLPAPPSAPGVP